MVDYSGYHFPMAQGRHQTFTNDDEDPAIIDVELEFSLPGYSQEAAHEVVFEMVSYALSEMRERYGGEDYYLSKFYSSIFS